jgi:hypothetical protein
VRNTVLGQHKNAFTDQQMGTLFEQWLINQAIAFLNYKQLKWKAS